MGCLVISSTPLQLLPQEVGIYFPHMQVFDGRSEEGKG